MAAAGEQSIYTWVLVPALLTDAADGCIARSFGLQSRLGARLDSLGDSLVWCAALAGLLALLPGWRADVKGVWWLRTLRLPRRPHGWPTS
jgi:phosphatidylglycerophosphate synthase